MDSKQDNCTDNLESREYFLGDSYLSNYRFEVFAAALLVLSNPTIYIARQSKSYCQVLIPNQTTLYKKEDMGLGY